MRLHHAPAWASCVVTARRLVRCWQSTFICYVFRFLIRNREFWVSGLHHYPGSCYCCEIRRTLSYTSFLYQQTERMIVVWEQRRG